MDSLYGFTRRYTGMTKWCQICHALIGNDARGRKMWFDKRLYKAKKKSKESVVQRQFLKLSVWPKKIQKSSQQCSKTIFLNQVNTIF